MPDRHRPLHPTPLLNQHRLKTAKSLATRSASVMVGLTVSLITALSTAVAAGGKEGSTAVTQVPCAMFAARLPNLKKELCEAAKLQPTTGRSVTGQTLWVRDITPAQPNLRVMVVGAIHGDELSSASLAFHWIQQALQAPAESPQSIAWRFIPVLNPDGVLVKPPRRMNANGVDLNRNFPTPNWERDAKNYWEKRTSKDPRRWPGPKPLSEPESQFLHQQMQSFQPQLIVSIHAPYGVLDFDGPAVPPSRLGRLYLDQVGIFPGSLGNYGGVHKGVPVVTIELPSALRTPLDAEMRQMWIDLLRWTNDRVATRLPGGTNPSVTGFGSIPRTTSPPSTAPL